MLAFDSTIPDFGDALMRGIRDNMRALHCLRRASLRIIALAFGFILSLPAASAADAPRLYKPAGTVTLGAPERWDYIVFDPASGRLYVTHGDRVSVVDGRTAAVTGTIAVTGGVTHGVGISTATGTGYTDDSEAGVAIPFDLATLKTGTPIKTAPDADGIVLDPASGHLLVINGDSGSVSAIDVHTNKVVATIDGGGGLEFGVADGKGSFYVDGAEHNELVRINTDANRVEAHWPLQGCERPHGIALDGATRRVFVSCANATLVIVDADSGRQIASFPIGKYNDGAVFDPVRKRVLAANGDGSLTVIQEKDANAFVPLGTVTTPPTARTIAIDEKTGRVFLAAADIAKVEPPSKPGGRPKVTLVPGSLKLIELDPSE
jgi:YVTN family beta-propeller protein